MLEGDSTRGVLFPLIAATLFAGAQGAGMAQDSSARVVQMINVYANVEKSVDAKKCKAGDPVLAKVTEGANLSDGTKVPTGSVLIGHIDSVTPSDKKSDSILAFTFDKVAIKGGNELPIKAVVVRVSTLASTFGQDQANNDPDANRPVHPTLGSPAAGGVINHPSDDTIGGPHPIPGLTLTGTADGGTSATLTQAKKNVQLNDYTQLIVSIAVAPH